MDSDAIVVGIDGSAAAQAALRWAAQAARQRGACLHVVHAGRLPAAMAGTRSSLEVVAPEVVDRGRALIEAALEQAEPALRDVDVLPRVTAGRGAGPALVRAAQGAALLAVGVHGRSGSASPRLGSVSEHSVVHASCPVVVVPDRPIDAAGPVVVGVDGSSESVGALGWALSEAAGRGVDLHAVAAYLPYTEGRPFGAAFMEAAAPGSVGRLRRAAERALEDGLAKTAGAHPDVVVRRSVLPGTASSVLCDVAQHASLLVVGSRGQGGLEGRLLGSVSRDCVRRAPCPVAVIRPR